MSNGQIDRKLRPNVEAIAAIGAGVAAITSIIGPSFFMMTPGVAYGSAAIFAGSMVKNAIPAINLKRYHMSLKRLRPYTIKPAQIPVSVREHFLGRGFRFTAKHTQRIAEAKKAKNDKYISQSFLYNLARDVERKAERHAYSKWVSSTLRYDSVFNPVRPLPPIGGNPYIHGVGGLEEFDLNQQLDERSGHTLCLGTTRVGKTRAQEVIVTGDIRRGGDISKGNNVVIMFDPKGDGELFKRAYTEAVRAGREKEFYYFNLGDPENSCRYNTVGEFQRVTEVASRTTGPLPNAGNSAAFKAFSWRFVNVVAQARVRIGDRPTIAMIARDVTDIDTLITRYTRKLAIEFFDDDEDAADSYLSSQYAKVQKNHPLVQKMNRSKKAVASMGYLEKNFADDAVAMLLCKTASYDKGWYDKLVASLLPFLDKLSTGPVAELLSPDYLNAEDKRPILSWREIIQKGGIVYFALDAMTDREVATAVGNTAFNDLVSIAGDLYKSGKNAGLPFLNGSTPSAKLEFPEIFLHADEFNSLIGDEFIPMLNQAGGAGIRVTAYTQSIADIEARLQDVAKARQIVDNFNTLIMMRVQTTDTARLLTDKLPEVDVYDSLAVSGARQVDDSLTNYQTSTEDRTGEKLVPMLTTSDIVGLPKGHAFVLMNGGQLYKTRFPLFDTRNDINVPASVEGITRKLNEKYSTGDSWWSNAA